MNMLVSDKNWQFTFSLDTQAYHLSIISDQCFDQACNVPKHYNVSDSSSAELDTNAKDLQWSINIENFKSLQQAPMLSAKPYNEKFKLQLDQFQREVSFENTFQVVYETSSPFVMDQSGFIGIAPWVEDRDQKQYNFMN